MTRRVGIRDVATAAGVSTTTVSHALSGRGKVSADTRDRVQQVALDLGYAPNRVASALRRQRTDILGFVSDQIAVTQFAGHIVLGAQDAANELGMSLMLVDSNRAPEVERRQIEVLRAQQVDALLYATMSHRRVVLPAATRGMTVVLVNAEDAEGEAPSVAPDEQATAETATRALLDAGHTRIVHLTIDLDEVSASGREAGYRAAMERAGLPPHVVVQPTTVAQASVGRSALRRAFDEDPELTAVFCFNDQMAMGAYQVAADRGLRIPDDLSVIGVDNLEIIANELRPGLTTLALPHYEMGRWAVEQAVRQLEDEAAPARRELLRCPMVTRGSIAPRG